jgi:hypothetical protein
MVMEIKDTSWYRHKMSAVCACFVGVIILWMSYSHLAGALDYQPKPQQVLLDIYNRPIGEQNLLEETYHNPSYRDEANEGGVAAEFAKEAVLRMFSYSHDELRRGDVLNRFMMYMNPDVGVDVYQEQFLNLSHQRTVMAQDGIVRARFIGELYWEGETELPYESMSGLSLLAKAHQFKGVLMVTTHADDIYPAVYNDVTITVQRALLQDKLHGYQIIKLEIR